MIIIRKYNFQSNISQLNKVLDTWPRIDEEMSFLRFVLFHHYNYFNNETVQNIESQLLTYE